MKCEGAPETGPFSWKRRGGLWYLCVISPAQMPRFIIIHRWFGYPEEGWQPWLKRELEELDCEVVIPKMPDPEEPRIGPWVDAVKKAAGEIGPDTFFVGYSIGNQAIWRMLQDLPAETKIGGMLMVAPWVDLKFDALEYEGDRKIAEPWISTRIRWHDVAKRTDQFHAVLSDDDYYVPVEDAEKFEESLGAQMVIETGGKGHLSGDDGITELPSALEACISMLEASRERA